MSVLAVLMASMAVTICFICWAPVSAEVRACPAADLASPALSALRLVMELSSSSAALVSSSDAACWLVEETWAEAAVTWSAPSSSIELSSRRVRLRSRMIQKHSPPPANSPPMTRAMPP